MKKKLLITALIVGFTGSISGLYATQEIKKPAHAPILEDDDEMDLDAIQMMASIKPKKPSALEQKMSLWGSWLFVSYINWQHYLKAKLLPKKSRKKRS